MPDVVTIGKAIGGGVPVGAYGLSAELAAAILDRDDLDLVDMGGVDGTLAGNALSVAAARATLEHVLTDSAFTQMTALATRFTDAVTKVIEAHAAVVDQPARRAGGVPVRAPGPPRRDLLGPERPTPSWRTTCTCTSPTAACCSLRSTTWR